MKKVRPHLGTSLSQSFPFYFYVSATGSISHHFLLMTSHKSLERTESVRLYAFSPCLLFAMMYRTHRTQYWCLLRPRERRKRMKQIGNEESAASLGHVIKPIPFYVSSTSSISKHFLLMTSHSSLERTESVRLCAFFVCLLFAMMYTPYTILVFAAAERRGTKCGLNWVRH